MRTVHTDCRFYRGDRPCLPHKLRGRLCEDCPEYVKGAPRVLLIKLGAMGDVVRTTPVLMGLRRKHPDIHLTWLVAGASADLLREHPQIDRLWTLDGSTAARLATEYFDLALNLDVATDSAALLAASRAETRLGYTLGEGGEVTCANPEAEAWLEMSLFDDLKRANTLTYQEHMFRLLGLDWNNEPITLAQPKRAWDDAQAFATREGLQLHERPVVGLNLGGGGRWQYKRWTPQGFIELARMLARELDARTLLFYGPEERELAQSLLPKLPNSAVDTGGHNPPSRFFALLGLCDVLVTGDSLGLHLMLAHGKPVVALFGPTSRTEIELYGLGEKIAPDLDCLVCYLETCDRQPNCMRSIEPERVLAACRTHLGVVRK